MLKKVLAVAGLLVTVAIMAACDVTDSKNQASANLYENAQNASEAKETIVKPAKRADAGEDELVIMTWVGEDALIIDMEDELFESCLSKRDNILFADEDSTNMSVIGQLIFRGEGDYLDGKVDCSFCYSEPDSGEDVEVLSLSAETICKDGRHKFLFREGHFNVNETGGIQYGNGEWDNVLPDDAIKHCIGGCSLASTGKIDSFKVVFEDNTQVLDEFNDSGALVKRNSENKDYLAEVFSSKDMEYLGQIGENYIVFSTTIPEVNRFEYKTSPFYREGRYVYDIYELAGTYMIPVDVSWVVSFTDFGREDKTIVKLSFAEDMDAVSMDPKIYGVASGDFTGDPAMVSDPAEFDTYRFHEAVLRSLYSYGSDVIFDGNNVYFTSTHALAEGLEYIGVWDLHLDVPGEEIFRDAKDNDIDSVVAKAMCLIRRTYDFNGVTQISEDFKERDYNINYYVHKSQQVR